MRAWLAIFLALACGQTAADDHAPSVTLAHDTFSCDCFPVYPADPTYATITLDYYAGDRAAEFHVLEVRHTFSDGSKSAVLVSHVSPEGSGLLTPEQHLEVEHVKLEGTGAGACGYSSEALEVDVSGPLGTVTLSRGAQSYECPQ